MILKRSGWWLLISKPFKPPFLSFYHQNIAGSAIESAPLPREERPTRGFTENVIRSMKRTGIQRSWRFQGWTMVNWCLSLNEFWCFCWSVELWFEEWLQCINTNINIFINTYPLSRRLRKRFRRGLKKDASARSIPSCLGHVHITWLKQCHRSQIHHFNGWYKLSIMGWYSKLPTLTYFDLFILTHPGARLSERHRRNAAGTWSRNCRFLGPSSQTWNIMESQMDGIGWNWILNDINTCWYMLITVILDTLWYFDG